jgi:transcriptional regulator with XRE-family HTH domain
MPILDGIASFFLRYYYKHVIIIDLYKAIGYAIPRFGMDRMNDHGSFYRQVGELIRAKRKDCGLSQEGLAEAIGLKRPSMSNIEKGRQNILLHTLYDIAETLGTTVDALLPKRSVAESNTLPDLDALPKDVREFVEAGINARTKGM